MSYDRIVRSSGKEQLDASTFVGITLTLLNAKLAFEARSGPAYVQCSVNGGNLVALDVNDVPISPIEPTAFTQVLVTSSSSATLQDSQSLQAGTFGGFVAIDVTSPHSGVDFPVGTRGSPVNNVSDAILIAEELGLRDIIILSNMTMTSGDWSDGYTFHGDSPVVLTLTLDPATNVTDCTFKDMTITGTLDGDNQLRNCVVQNISFFNGAIYESALDGTVTLGGGVQAGIFDCWSNVAGGGIGAYPTIDMGGSGQDMIIRNYSGGIAIVNGSGVSDAVSIDMLSGRVVFDATITDGSYTVRGLADVTLGGATADITDSTINALNAAISKVLRNKTITDPVTGVMTVYDDDDVTILFQGNVYEDHLGVTAYKGAGAERRDRLV
jgi:hypothetical protein